MNEKGILEFESYDGEMKNVKTFELSEEEYMYHIRQDSSHVKVFYCDTANESK
jgi:hypothetical protein